MVSPYEGPREIELEPDLDMIRNHLKWNFEFIYYGSIQISHTDPGSGELNRHKSFDIDDLDQAAEFAYETNQKPGHSVYFRPASLVTCEDKSATDKDFHMAPGVWVDCDSQESAYNIKGKTSDLSYNAYTITGRHPYTRVQAYWRLQDGVNAGEDVRHYNKVLCSLVGGDPMVTNPTTLMRLGGTIAWPYKEGRRPELTSFNVKGDQEAQRAIPRAQLVEKLIEPFAPVVAIAEQSGLGLIQKKFDLALTLKLIAEGQDRHANVVAAAGHMVARNYDDLVIYELIKSKVEEFYDWSDVLERELQAAISSAHRKFDPEDLAGEQVTDTPAVEVQPITSRAYQIVGGHSIPPREWIYEPSKHYVKGYMTATVAEGGIGKSSNALMELLCCATGIDYFNDREPLVRPYKVWYFNLEDPYDELCRRVEACAIHYNITQEDIGDRLLINSGRDQKLIIAKELNQQVTVVEPIAQSLKDEILRLKIDLLVVDPFIHSHAVSENSNEAIGAVSDIWKEIAHECNCGVELIHHTRKIAPGVEASATDARGASGLVGAARSVRAISRLEKSVVERHGIKENHKRFYFFGDGKSNLAPPPESSYWRKLVSIDLDNATPEYVNGDSVQVSTTFIPPDAFSGITTQNLVDVQLAISRGDERVRKSEQSSDWLGYLVAEICELEISDRADKARVRKIIKTWVENERLVEVKVKNKSRQDVPAYGAGELAT